MARGRGCGWEESVQHKVLCKYLKNKYGKKAIKHEDSVEIVRFKNGATQSRIDFAVHHRGHIELIECKASSHPWLIEAALGKLLIHRALMKMVNHISKKIKLAICMVDGYKYGANGDEWTSEHDKLITHIEKVLGEKIKVYLLMPKPKWATKKYWNNQNKQEVILQSH
jgi:hypothetical protein